MSHSNFHQSYYSSETFQAFYRWMRDNHKSTGYDQDRKFLPFDLVSAHLESNQYEVLNDLLCIIYQGSTVSISAKEVVGAGYLRIFCILICIRKAEFLEVFMRSDDLNDTHLPFKPHEPPTGFPIDHTAPKFFEDFCNQQWSFCPPNITVNCNRRLDPQLILPFTSKEHIASGASAEIYTIKVYPLYNFLSTLWNEPSGSSPTTYALKTYQGKDAEKSWNNEVHAFQQLSHSRSPNIIGFYTAFKHGSTCHIILEHADRGSLEDYLKLNTPPVNSMDVARFWKRVLKLLRGLKDLHNGNEVVYHQDIKPANVLVLSDLKIDSPFASTFKIADLGTSHSKRISASDNDHSDKDAQGTRSYGAPDCYRSDGTFGQGDIRVTPTVDVFSLGCILSEVAVWMIGGYDLLIQYRRARREAISQLPDFPDGDFFHNGIRMLPIVAEWHSMVLAKAEPANYPFASQFIPMIEEMLQDVQHRGDAMSFCTIASQRFAEALLEFQKQSPDIFVPHDILTSSLRRQRCRTDPPVPPSNIEQRESALPSGRTTLPPTIANFPIKPILSTPFVNSPVNTLNLLPHESLSWSELASVPAGKGKQDSHPLASDPRPGRHGHVITNAPIEVLRPFFENDLENQELRRYSEQPQAHQIMDKPVGANGPASAIIGSKSAYPPLVGPTTLSPQAQESGVGPSINGNNFHPNEMKLLHANNAYSTLMDRPSTCTPLKLPPVAKATFPDTTPASKRSPVRYLSRKDGIAWRDAKKKNKKMSPWSSDPPLPHQWVLDFMNGRDSVFIIDDSESMRSHWKDMTELLGILAYLIKSRDTDGIDLYLASQETKHNESTSTKLVSIVEKRSSHREDMGCNDISLRLEQVLGDFARKIQLEATRGVKSRGLNVYIFTDGIWTPSCNIVPAIDNITKKLRTHGLPEKHVGLQFISFGKDPEGLEKLRLVDNCLVAKPDFPYDIVDTTPSTGNLYKMIRGAIDRDFDYDFGGQPSTATSSSFIP